jgi:hypothetical protein
VSVEASEMVSIPRAELDALRAELRRLRREVGRGVAQARIRADPGPGDDAREGSLLKPGELVSGRRVASPERPGKEVEALPQPVRWTVQRTIFHLLDEPVPTLADPCRLLHP